MEDIFDLLLQNPSATGKNLSAFPPLMNSPMFSSVHSVARSVSQTFIFSFILHTPRDHKDCLYFYKISY